MRHILLTAGLGLGLLATEVHARVGLSELGKALEAELGLTRQAVALEEALVTLDNQQLGAEHGAELLDHAGRESLRLLDAYRSGRSEREHVARLRARAMYKASRGGIARLVFEDVGRGDASTSADRVARGRDLRWMVRHDLRELASYQRSERRARDELLLAHRQLQALSALATVHAVQGDFLAGARMATGPALKRAHARTRRAIPRAPKRIRASGINHERQRELRSDTRELRALRKGEPKMRRPVRGRVVGSFGDYEDPVLRLPMMRNGIELAARRDESVRALAEGKVVMVATLPGFEQVVVIDHGGGRMSMTGRLWKASVEEGDEVDAGQIIAAVAPKIIDDGLGTTIYVELRLGDKPVDPAPLLRSR